MLDYSRLVVDYRLNSTFDIMNFFVDCMTDIWIDMYIDEVKYYGCITLQYYKSFSSATRCQQRLGRMAKISRHGKIYSEKSRNIRICQTSIPRLNAYSDRVGIRVL